MKSIPVGIAMQDKVSKPKFVVHISGAKFIWCIFSAKIIWWIFPSIEVHFFILSLLIETYCYTCLYIVEGTLCKAKVYREEIEHLYC